MNYSRHEVTIFIWKKRIRYLHEYRYEINGQFFKNNWAVGMHKYIFMYYIEGIFCLTLSKIYINFELDKAYIM